MSCETKIKRADGKLEVNLCACDGTNFVLADLTGKVVTHLEPETGSGITSVTLHKLSTFQTAGAADAYAEATKSGSAVTFTVTAGKINRLPDLGDGMNWGKCKLVFNTTIAAPYRLGIHSGS